jgi:branched-subunit amino acid ABC-type transport system permease component
MKRLVLASAIASSIAVSGCATDPYYGDPQGRRVATGAAIGGATGAVVGAVVPGVNPITGAVVGAVLGGVAGAVIKGRQYYRDTRGYCYYVDQYGNPIYDYNVRC